eukprot:4744088-Pleurochrysis_carterae.AAC.1
MMQPCECASFSQLASCASWSSHAHGCVRKRAWDVFLCQTWPSSRLHAHTGCAHQVKSPFFGIRH